MASHALPSSTSAVVVVASASEDLMKKTEDALGMGGFSQMSGPFRAFCAVLKTCSLDEILMILPVLLKGCESEKENSYMLLDAFSENCEMKKALIYLLKETDCSAYYNSARILDGLCSALDKAQMERDYIQILTNASQKQDVSLRAVVCKHFCSFINAFRHHVLLDLDPDAITDTMLLAAIDCQDNDQSKDLSVIYFEALFHDQYFWRKEVSDLQLSAVIRQARDMLVSAEPKRMSDANIFFLRFIPGAKAEQFALLPEATVEEWKARVFTREYGYIFKYLCELYQKRVSASLALSSSVSATAVATASAPEDLV